MTESSLHKTPQKEMSSDVDPIFINHQFETMNPEQVVLLGTHTTKPDGFLKSLIIGKLLPSTELLSIFGSNYVRTFRGYCGPLTNGQYNDTISFSAGTAARAYTQSSSIEAVFDWTDGFGFSYPAASILEKPNSSVFFLSAGIIFNQIAPQLEAEGRLPVGFSKYLHARPSISSHTPKAKQEALDLINLARLGKELKDYEKAEIVLRRGAGFPSSIDLSESVILIPRRKREIVTRYMQIRLAELCPYSEIYKSKFLVDIDKLSPENIFALHPNIYWYPQSNIGDCVKFLTCHPNLVKQLINQQK